MSKFENTFALLQDEKPTIPRWLSSFRDLADTELTTLSKNLEDTMSSQMFRYALFPGRRLRPALFLQTTNLLGVTNDEATLKISTAIEILHHCSIIVDDLVDGDELRRDIPTFQAKYGPHTTVCFSHYLIGVLYDVLAGISVDGNMRKQIQQMFAMTHKTMSHGELADLGVLTSTNSVLNYYLDTALSKTYSIFSLVFCVAGVLANLSKDKITLLSQLGQAVGQHYQIANDLHDVVVSEDSRKDSTRFSLTLPAAVSMEYVSQVERLRIQKAICEGFPNKDFRIWFKSTICENNELVNKMKVLEASAHFNVQQLVCQMPEPSEWDFVLQLCEAVRSIVFWNHSEFEEAGYAR